MDKSKISKGPVCFNEFGVSRGEGDPVGGGYPPNPRRICNTNDGEYVENPNAEADGELIAEAFNTFNETGMTPAELGRLYKLAKAWYDAQSLWNTAMDDRNPDMADATDALIAQAEGELYNLMDTINKGK